MDTALLTDKISGMEAILRLMVFAGIFVLLWVLESAFPRRALSVDRRRRWITNIGFSIINTVTLRFFLPFLAIDAAFRAHHAGIGLFNQFVLPFPLAFLFSLLLLDFVIYGQHVLMHKVDWLWRLHAVHHTDRDLDVSTAVRFHPVEICLSMILKTAIVLVFGIHPFSLVIFEILLNATAMFSHANMRLPVLVDKALRTFIVTPDMHRIHHSAHEPETNSNYGFNLSLWDRIFATYTENPEKGQTDVTLGLAEHQSENPLKLGWSLLYPFHKHSGRLS